MMDSLIAPILTTLAMMLLVAFFAGVEIAFLAASIVKIELKQRQGDRAAKILSYFKKNTHLVLITILIGNNIALILYAQEIDEIFAQLFQLLIGYEMPKHDLLLMLLKSVIDTLILLVLAEYIPKAIFRRTADTVIYPSAYILKFFYYLLWIPIQIANYLSKGMLRLMGVSVEEEVVGIDKKDLDNYIQEVIDSSEGNEMQEVDTEILSNAMTFTETRVREFMIPRTEMVAISIEDKVSDLMDLFVETKHSRIVVYEGNLDNIKGFFHSTSMFRKPKNIKDFMQPVLVVPEIMSANVLIKEFADKKRSVAVVVDEYGGTAGMITVEDLVEEVFGDIEDEYDEDSQKVAEEDMVFEKHEDGSLTIGARQNIFDLNENYELELPESEHYTTLGGLIMHQAGEIPTEGTVFSNIEPYYTFTILKATPTKILAVKVKKKTV